MTGNRKQVARVLGWAGLVPFAVLAWISYLGVPDWIDILLVGYAVAILGFLAGTLWAGALAGESERTEALVASNVIVLAALPALVLPVAWACGLLAVLFAAELVAEWRWTRRGQAGWYQRLRATLSMIAVALLVIGALAAFSSPALERGDASADASIATMGAGETA